MVHQSQTIKKCTLHFLQLLTAAEARDCIIKNLNSPPEWCMTWETQFSRQAYIQLFKYVSKAPMEADRLAVSHMEATSGQADISTQLHLCKVLSQNHPARPFPKFPLTGTMRSLATFKLLKLESICKQQEPTNVVPKISLLLYWQLWPGALSYHTEFASRSLILGEIHFCVFINSNTLPSFTVLQSLAQNSPPNPAKSIPTSSAQPGPHFPIFLIALFYSAVTSYEHVYISR